MNTQWIYVQKGHDIMQHQLGFEFFLNDVWHFPFGNYNNMIYPVGTSVVYTDSIPLMAILFKVFRSFLPDSFQYFGIWGGLCFTLQGALSAIILQKYINSKLVIFSVLPIFVYSSTLVHRMFGHTALGGQWIILLSIAAFIYSHNFKSIKIKILVWAGITSLSVMVHAYFLPMVGIVMFFYLIGESIEKHTCRNAFIIFMAVVASTIVVFFLIGGFSTSGSFAESGVGEYSMNVNALFNSGGRSRIFRALPYATNGQYEGFQFLGAGMMVILLSCLFKAIANPRRLKDGWGLQNSLLLGIILSLFVLAASPKVSFMNKVIIDYSSCLWFVRLMSPFRSTGRLFWPAFYLIQFGMVSFLYNNTHNKKALICFLLCCSFVHVWDMSDFLIEKGAKVKTDSIYINNFEKELSNELIRNKHIYYLSSDGSQYEDLAIAAFRYGLTLNDGNVARKDAALIQKKNTEVIEGLLKGIIRDDTIYVIADEYTFVPEQIDVGIVKKIDNFVVIYCQ